MGALRYCVTLEGVQGSDAAQAAIAAGPSYAGWTVVSTGEEGDDGGGGGDLADAGDSGGASALGMAVICAGSVESWFGAYLWMVMLIAGLAGFSPEHGAYSGVEEQLVMLFVAVCAALLWSHIIGTGYTASCHLLPHASHVTQNVHLLAILIAPSWI